MRPLATSATIPHMCPWMAWYGQAAPMQELLFNVRRGLMDRDTHVAPGADRAEGNGFGVGWYQGGAGPDVYRSVSPAWEDQKVRELAAQVQAPVFLAHVRAESGTGAHETNCHPFRHGRWLFVHNGILGGFDEIREELMLAVSPSLRVSVQGSTDSEVLFHLALTFGLQSDPVGALERAVGYVEQVAARHHVPRAVHASLGLSDGESVWAVRYSTLGSSGTLYASGDIHALQMLYPGNPRLQRLREGDHILVSQPLADLAGAWDPVGEATVVILAGGRAEKRLFRPDRTVAEPEHQPSE
jgi:predicted glutamine amidotransferase